MLYAPHPRYLTTTEWSTLYGGKKAGMLLLTHCMSLGTVSPSQVCSATKKQILLHLHLCNLHWWCSSYSQQVRHGLSSTV